MTKHRWYNDQIIKIKVDVYTSLYVSTTMWLDLALYFSIGGEQWVTAGWDSMLYCKICTISWRQIVFVLLHKTGKRENITLEMLPMSGGEGELKIFIFIVWDTESECSQKCPREHPEAACLRWDGIEFMGD